MKINPAINLDIEEQNGEGEYSVEAHSETAILKSISDGFVALDRDWRYTYVNAAGARLLGKTPEELLGKNMWELWQGAADSQFGRAARRAVDENTPVNMEAFYPEPFNTWFNFGCYPSPTGLTILFRDVTAQRLGEERLRAKQKLEGIGVLAGGVAHNFNNLLTVIMLSAGAALEERPGCGYTKSILSASERAASLARQLMAFAGKSSFVTEPVDLSSVVSQSRELIRASVPKKIRLSFSLSKEMPCLEADPSRIEQILMELAINAGESIASETGGLVEITTSACEITSKVARLHSQAYDLSAGPYICLEVRDNGSGMDEAATARIFDPFFSTKLTGRGLGLAAVHGIVRTAKGFIEVRSSPGQGSTIQVFLPAMGPRMAELQLKTTAEPARNTDADAATRACNPSSTVLY